MMTSPPRPPSPPEGPPRGTNFSRRKAMQPLPPSPAFTRIFASSMNMGMGTHKRGYVGPELRPRSLSVSNLAVAAVLTERRRVKVALGCTFRVILFMNLML